MESLFLVSVTQCNLKMQVILKIRPKNENVSLMFVGRMSDLDFLRYVGFAGQQARP